MACDITEVNWTFDAEAPSQQDLQNAITNAHNNNNQPTTIAITSDFVVSGGGITIPAGSRIKLTGYAGTIHVIDGNHQSRLFTLQTDENEQSTIFHVEGVKLTHGYTTDNGGGILSEGDGECEVVVLRDAIIDQCEAQNGGAIYLNEGGNVLIQGGSVDHNRASGDGGAIYSPCVQIESGFVNYNAAGGSGGAIRVRQFFMSGGYVQFNTAAQNGGGIMLLEDGDITGDASITNNEAQNGGGGIYKTINSYHSLTISGRVGFHSNRANGTSGGGAIWVAHEELPLLFVKEQAAFTDNRAVTSVLVRDQQDDATYLSNITTTSGMWSISNQGYNNYDIAYIAGEQPSRCTGVGSQMMEMSLPVSVRPYTRIGMIRSRCCGPARVTPGYEKPEEASENCDFTIHQTVCVEVPVEFGATVTPGEAFTECSGEGCESCDVLPSAEPVE